MAQRTSPPYRADHVGSLLRPQKLMQAREDHKAGKLDDAELKAIEDEAIKDVVKMQEDVGLQSATDGEFRRASWHMDFIYQLDGVNTAPGNLKVEFRNEEGTIEFTPAKLHIDGKLGVGDTIFGDHFAFLKDQVTTNTPKLTIPSPSMVHYRGGRAAIDESVYPDMDGFWDDLTSAYAEEVRRLGELGCTYLQFDDTSLAYLNDPKQREMMAQQEADTEHLHERYIRHINEALEGRPEGMAITTHMCRGNFRSSWVAEGGYDFVAEALFNELAGRRLLHGVGRRPLRRLRAAALRPAREDRRPRPRHHQEGRPRGQGPAQAPHRGGVAVRRRRPALPLAPVRLLVHRRGQRAQP